jgi:hypothetical protein
MQYTRDLKGGNSLQCQTLRPFATTIETKIKPWGALGDNSMERLEGFWVVIPSAQESAKGWDVKHEGSQRLN